jgi:hypothetical protein
LVLNQTSQVILSISGALITFTTSGAYYVMPLGFGASPAEEMVVRSLAQFMRLEIKLLGFYSVLVIEERP